MTQAFPGDTAEITLLRDGAELKVSYRLGASPDIDLVLVHERARVPEYMIVAGLVRRAGRAVSWPSERRHRCSSTCLSRGCGANTGDTGTRMRRCCCLRGA